MLYGPLNAEITNKSQTFSTDLIQGDFITLELFEPVYANNTTKLKINKVIHGYKNMFETSSSSNYGNARSCHNNVNCNGFSNWQSRSNSVAMVLLADGTRARSGSLLNNTCQDFTPNFLTAFHCIDIGNNIDQCELEYGNGQLNQNEINRAQNWVFRFQYKCTTRDRISKNSLVITDYNSPGFQPRGMKKTRLFPVLAAPYANPSNTLSPKPVSEWCGLV